MKKLSPVPDDDPIYPPGWANVTIFRAFAHRVLGGAKSPRLRIIRIGNRNAVVLSHEDLTNGLGGAGVDGVVGYTPTAATTLVRNIVLTACAR